MGLRDLFRRKPREVDWTAQLRESGRPPSAPSGSAPSDRSTASDDVPTYRATPVAEGFVSSMNVTTTTIGPDGRQIAVSGEEALAQIPPQARRQLEALGLDHLITGAGTTPGSGSAMGFADVMRLMKAMPGIAAGQAGSGMSVGAGSVDSTAGAPAPAEEAAGADEDPVARLRALADLRDRGVITEDEFMTLKERLIDSTGDGQGRP